MHGRKSGKGECCMGQSPQAPQERLGGRAGIWTGSEDREGMSEAKGQSECGQ